ncbi:MAG: monovalent cation/H(+) antiporter subunit G [Ignavibacteriaceae bacterium]|nr:monovalent cation/H(+) antiporter subunit G [Ignavibacteriaceae bacterium]
MSETILSVMLITGAFFILISAIGIVKMPDIFMRMSSSTKASTLGIALIVIAAGIFFNDIGVFSRVVLISLFLLITAPVAAHMLGKAAYLEGDKLWENTQFDRYKEYIEKEEKEIK